MVEITTATSGAASQAEALSLAEKLERYGALHHELAAAAELRRLHAITTAVPADGAYAPLPEPAWHAKTIGATEDAYCAAQMRAYADAHRTSPVPAQEAVPAGYLNPEVIGPDGRLKLGSALTFSRDKCHAWTMPIFTMAPRPQAPAAGAAPTDAMVDAYLLAQRRAVEEADRFGRPNIGALHTDTVREACRTGLAAALGAAAPVKAAPTPDAADLSILSAGAKSGDPGTLALAAQLAGVPACSRCGYVKQHCRCAAPAQEAEEKPDEVDEAWAQFEADAKRQQGQLTPGWGTVLANKNQKEEPK